MQNELCVEKLVLKIVRTTLWETLSISKILTQIKTKMMERDAKMFLFTTLAMYGQIP